MKESSSFLWRQYLIVQFTSYLPLPRLYRVCLFFPDRRGDEKGNGEKAMTLLSSHKEHLCNLNDILMLTFMGAYIPPAFKSKLP